MRGGRAPVLVAAPHPDPLPASGAREKTARSRSGPMPSLKDLRNRIALGEGDAQDHQGHADGRRGQAAPRAGGRHRRAALRRAHGPRARQPRQARHQPAGRVAAARRHRQGRHAPADRHDRRARPVRRLQLQHRRASPAAMPSACAPPARRSSSCASAARATTRCGASTAARSSIASTSRASSRSAFANAADIAQKVRALFEAGEFDVATLYFSEFKSVISQKPTALQLIPVKLPRDARAPTAPPRPRPSTSTSPTRARS